MRIARFSHDDAIRFGIVDGTDLVVLAGDPLFAGFETTGERVPLGEVAELHFPPTDPQWKGAASRIFLEHAAKLVRENGGTIMNADVSLIAEAPKIGPHREEMREKLAEILGISVDRCSVKATTNEKIGFIGRREGIAAIATATVVFGSPK